MFLTSPDGIRIVYDVQGEGPTLFLLPGFRQVGNLYELGYVEQLRRHFQVITMDRRGMEKIKAIRQRNRHAYTVEKMLDDIYSVADACGTEHFCMWGHSFGGSQTLQLAARSNRISHAVVAGSFLGMSIPMSESGQLSLSCRRFSPHRKRDNSNASAWNLRNKRGLSREVSPQ